MQFQPTHSSPQSPTRCPRCESQRIKRNGRIGGVQYFYCHGCRRSFNAETDTNKLRVRRLAEFRQYEANLSRGRPLRQDAAWLGVSVATVWRWRHRVLRAMVQEQAEAGPQLQGEVAVQGWTLDRERTRWSWWFNVYWRRFRGPYCTTPPLPVPTTVLFVTETTPLERNPFNRKRPESLPRESVHVFPPKGEPPAQGTTVRPASPQPKGPPKLPEKVQAMCYVLQGVPSRDDFATLMPKILKPGSIAQTDRGRLQVMHPNEYPPARLREPEFDEDNNPVFLPEFFYQGRVKWFASGGHPAQVDRTRLLKVRHTFLHWMMRFRGVSVKYLDRYVAWFNAAIANTSALFEIPEFMANATRTPLP